VFGLMPHPEHAVEAALFGDDGLKIFQSMVLSHSKSEDRQHASGIK
jgi:phosphoribosylformylglycinamidine (FGAM) synthase-like amidotransferase family enzyme